MNGNLWGYHHLAYHQDARDWQIFEGAKSMTVFENYWRSASYMTTAMIDAPEETGIRHADWWAEWLKPLGLREDRIFCCPLNEPDTNVWGPQIDRYNAAFIERLWRKHHLRSGALMLSVGHPHTVGGRKDTLPDWSVFRGTLAALKESGSRLSLHEYGMPDNTITSAPPTAGRSVGWKASLFGATYALGIATYTLAAKVGASGWLSLFNNVNPANDATATAMDSNAFFGVNATYMRYAGELGEDWINATLSGVWTAYSTSYHTPGYKKLGDIVMLRGLLATSSTSGNGTVIFTLPLGYRPAKSVILAARTNNGTDPGMSHVAIASDGTLNFTGDATGWCSLEGLWFSTSAA